jgi:phosphohistidine phosphatase
VRARETADIVAASYRSAARVVLPALAPGAAPRTLLQWLRRQPDDASVALVGHEPDLGRLAGWLLTGRAAGFVNFKKGAAMLIGFDGAPRAGGGTLGWLLTAAQLAGLR